MALSVAGLLLVGGALAILVWQGQDVLDPVKSAVRHARGPPKFALPAARDLVTQAVGPEGRTINVQGTGTDLDGMQIRVPPGAVDDPTEIKVRYAESDDTGVVPEGTRRASPQVYVESLVGNEFERPIDVTVPVRRSSPSNPVVPVAYDPQMETWDAASVGEVPATNGTQDVVVIETIRPVVIALLEFTESDLVFDTGFIPSDDGWEVDNLATYLAQGGNSLGMSSFAKWYFQAEGAPYLSDAYAEDVQEGIASRVQLSESSAWTELQFGRDSVGGDAIVGLQVVALMRVTHMPQILLMGDDGSATHAVLVTAYDGSSFNVYDPDFPNERRSLGFSVNGGFASYGGFGEFGLYALSGLGSNERFENVHEDAEEGYFDSDDLVLTSPQEGAQVQGGLVTVAGTTSGRLADATHATIFVGGDAFSTSIFSGSFSLQVPVNQVGTVPILVIVGDEDPEVSSGSGVASVNIQREAGVRFLVTLTWDQPDTDVDLYVEEPDGEDVWYSSRTSSSGGQLDVDDTNGFGPEHYTLDPSEGDDVESGNYRIRAHFYSDHRSSPGPVSCRVTVIDYADPSAPSIDAVEFVLSGPNSGNNQPSGTGSDWFTAGSYGL